MAKSAHEMWHEQGIHVRNRYRQDYFDYMLRVVEQAKLDGNNFILALALNACGDWMNAAGRLKEALSFYEQRLDPSVWQEDELEIRSLREFVKRIKREIESSERTSDGEDRDSS
jgi:hypothetical protein